MEGTRQPLHMLDLCMIFLHRAAILLSHTGDLLDISGNFIAAGTLLVDSGSDAVDSPGGFVHGLPGLAQRHRHVLKMILTGNQRLLPFL